MFSLHVMDYEEEDPSNKLLFWFAIFSIIASIFGGVLSYFVIFKISNLNALLGGTK